jgi:hypothetical protein
MAAGKTYEPIATTTTTSASPAVTFSNISQNYTDLILIVSIRANSTPTSFGTGVRFNSDTGTNYSRTVAYGTGSATASFNSSNQSRIFFSAGSTNANQFNVIRLNIMNYSNSTTYKTVIARNDDMSDVISMTAALWRSTSAITSVTITPYDDNSTGFATGSTFTLYGIKAA